MIGHDQPSTHNASAVDNKVQLSAGDLLGRTHEELVLLLIQLRRQSSALVKARDACLLEMESQVTQQQQPDSGGCLFISNLVCTPSFRIYTNAKLPYALLLLSHVKHKVEPKRKMTQCDE